LKPITRDRAMASGTLQVRAFAKINVGLKILRQRSDGYHEIRTIYQTVALHDNLQIAVRRSGDRIVLHCDDPRISSGRENLVYRACELWRQARQFRGSIEVDLHKRIPTGSGLGGASTDAAAALLGLERLTGNRLIPAVRFELAARLGSDVPLFLWGGRVLGCGRGEEVYPLPDLSSCACLLVYPGFSVSTAEAYHEASLRLTLPGQQLRMDGLGAWPQFSRMDWGPAENDFEEVVFAKWPELARFKARLIRAGAETASLTGSGSAVYALFHSVSSMHSTARFIPPGWRVFWTRTLRRAAYQRLLFKERQLPG
jgi:4-diphosphocytidyl-2-C-methyl-D-erythritol kinase